MDSNLSESEIKPDNFDISLQQKVRGENHWSGNLIAIQEQRQVWGNISNLPTDQRPRTGVQIESTVENYLQCKNMQQYFKQRHTPYCIAQQISKGLMGTNETVFE